MLRVECKSGLIVLDLPPTVGLAHSVTSSFLAGIKFEDNTPLRPRFFIKGGDLGKVLNQIYKQLKIHIKVLSAEPPNKGWKQRANKRIINASLHNFHHGGGNEVNAYGGSKYGHVNFISRGHDGYGNFTPKRYNGVSNFSPYAKSYWHTSYDDYWGYDRDNVKYDYYEQSLYNCH
ncbi:hypothetical protein M9H77_30629 [Catharanthus roseus]|uniref:Uncharacterized protein n=1 Tax=Catharanthus roseus TaxID=4058 RepID=A0ACB9ZXU5_CATRO|nr:hypothetical protein M9H77_30629 [Catharanthus roseus]